MKRYAVFPIDKLLQDQQFVYCNLRETAEAVADHFNKDTRDPVRYRWKRGWLEDDGSHFAVVKLEAWTVVPTWLVQPGEVYIGIFPHETDEGRTFRIASGLMTGDYAPGNFRCGVGPIRDPGLAVVRREDDTPFRSELAPGDCFVYMDDVTTPRVVECRDVNLTKMPANWQVSTPRSAECRMGVRVARIPCWLVRDWRPLGDAVPESAGDIFAHVVNGLTGAECLARLEAAMRTESLCASYDHMGTVTGHVSTLGGAGLDREQAALGRAAWAERLRQLGQEHRERERVQVVCDYQDEP